MEITKETNDLRSIYRIFCEPLPDDPEHALAIAKRSDFIKMGGKKFYLDGNGGKEVNSETATKLCCSCEVSPSGFLALLKNHPDHPNHQVFAFQCDSCNMIYVLSYDNDKV